MEAEQREPAPCHTQPQAQLQSPANPSRVRPQSSPAQYSLAELKAMGKALRDKCPRASHAEWKPPGNRPDPVRVVLETDKGAHTRSRSPSSRAHGPISSSVAPASTDTARPLNTRQVKRAAGSQMFRDADPHALSSFSKHSSGLNRPEAHGIQPLASHHRSLTSPSHS